VVALHLNAFIRHGALCKIGYFTSMMTAIGINYPRLARLDKPVMLNTIFYPFELYSRTCGQLSLDVFTAAILSPARIWDALTMVFARWM